MPLSSSTRALELGAHPPDGWAISRAASTMLLIQPRADHEDYRLDNLPVLVERLREWCVENNVVLSPYSSTYIVHNLVGYYTPFYMQIHDPGHEGHYTNLVSLEPFECWRCEGEVPVGSRYCPTEGCGASLTCNRCNTFGRRIYYTVEDELACETCTRVCADTVCSARTVNDEYCIDCDPSVACNYCDRDTRNENEVCDYCQENLCADCGELERDGLPHYVEDVGYVCGECFGDRTVPGPHMASEFDDADEDEGLDLRVPAIPGREAIRSCGVELEYGGNGQALARALYNAGLSEYDSVQSYHSSSRRHSAGGNSFVIAENDASVDVELVTRPINPADDEDMRLLKRTLSVIRSLVKEEKLKLDSRCGNHIHVSAKGMAYRHVANLNKRFGWMEDVLFRFAAAKWSRGHRGTGYAGPVPKNCRSIDELRHERYFGVSYLNYFDRIAQCRCGAVMYDATEDCTCDLGKCTLEFRLFNTTANPIKLHAHLAVCQALVADAIQGENLFGVELPPLEYIHQHYDDMTSVAQEERVELWKPRIEWLLNDLVLTNEERKSILYCIRNSELRNVGEDFLTEVANGNQTALPV